MTKADMGDGLFAAWRYDANGQAKPDLVVDIPSFEHISSPVSGSKLPKAQAEAEYLNWAFGKADFEWRGAGCSMCLAMNDN